MATTTAQSLIARAFRLAKVVGSGETYSAAELTDGLESLNDMLESWSVDKTFAYALQNVAVPLVGGKREYTLGPTGADVTVAPRPPRIENAFLRVDGLDYPVELYDRIRYDSLVSKSVSGDVAMVAHYEPMLPSGKLDVWPVPNRSATMYLTTWVTVGQFADLTTEVELAPGMRRTISYNLAIELAAEYEQEPSSSVVKIAADSLGIVKRLNRSPDLMETDLIRLFGPRVFNIFSGDIR